MSGYWRKKAAPIIAKVLDECEGKSMKEKRAALREAYPFGQRRYWPYKVWCDEVMIQLGLKVWRGRRGKTPNVPENPDQMTIFELLAP